LLTSILTLGGRWDCYNVLTAAVAAAERAIIKNPDRRCREEEGPPPSRRCFWDRGNAGVDPSVLQQAWHRRHFRIEGFWRGPRWGMSTGGPRHDLLEYLPANSHGGSCCPTRTLLECFLAGVPRTSRGQLWRDNSGLTGRRGVQGAGGAEVPIDVIACSPIVKF
jgi:hypothetical protein